MEKTFIIAWRSKTEARWGQGKRLFTREEAAALAEEMNCDYPAFIHEPQDTAAPQLSAAPEPAIIHVDFHTTPEVAIPVSEDAPQEAVTA